MAQHADADADGGDGSMETILASIRRIIREDEAGTEPPATDDPAEEDEDELLVLQPSMMVSPIIAEEATVSTHLPLAGAARDAAELAAALFDDEPLPMPAPVAVAPPVVVALPAAAPMPEPMPEPMPATMLPRPTHSLTALGEEPLLDPQAHALAAQALASLQEAVRPPPPPAEMRLLRSGGPTIEDLVRDELRGQLKLWLDSHLPPLVERLVRQEIERLVRPI